jgi:hypothetical protein
VCTGNAEGAGQLWDSDDYLVPDLTFSFFVVTVWCCPVNIPVSVLGKRTLVICLVLIVKKSTSKCKSKIK